MNNKEMNIDKIKGIVENYLKLMKHTREYKNALLDILNDIDTEMIDVKIEGGSFTWKPDKGRKYISTSLLNNYLLGLIEEAKEENTTEKLPQHDIMKEEIEKNCSKIILPKWKLKIKFDEE